MPKISTCHRRVPRAYLYTRVLLHASALLLPWYRAVVVLLLIATAAAHLLLCCRAWYSKWFSVCLLNKMTTNNSSIKANKFKQIHFMIKQNIFHRRWFQNKMTANKFQNKMTHGKAPPSLHAWSWFDVWVVGVWAFFKKFGKSKWQTIGDGLFFSLAKSFSKLPKLKIWQTTFSKLLEMLCPVQHANHKQLHP